MSSEVVEIENTYLEVCLNMLVERLTPQVKSIIQSYINEDQREEVAYNIISCFFASEVVPFIASYQAATSDEEAILKMEETTNKWISDVGIENAGHSTMAGFMTYAFRSIDTLRELVYNSMNIDKINEQFSLAEQELLDNE